MSDESAKREAISRVAQRLVKSSGGTMSQEAAERRVAKAVKVGDMKRDNRHR